MDVAVTAPLMGADIATGTDLTLAPEVLILEDVPVPNELVEDTCTSTSLLNGRE
jgi:hypothetical protein